MSEELPVETLAGQLADAKVVFTATLRMNLAIHHLLGAAEFARQVSEIESKQTGQPLGEFFERILWYSSACVLSCAAGLEAYANEMFVDRSMHFPVLPGPVADRLWELLELKTPIDKFDMALLLRERSVLDRGSEPTNAVVVMIKVRNSLTHFKPEWNNAQSEHGKLAKALAGRFKPSPFLPTSESLFPRRWASAGACKWAVSTCVEFLSAFEAMAGLPSKIDAFKDRLEV